MIRTWPLLVSARPDPERPRRTCGQRSGVAVLDVESTVLSAAGIPRRISVYASPAQRHVERECRRAMCLFCWDASSGNRQIGPPLGLLTPPFRRILVAAVTNGTAA